VPARLVFVEKQRVELETCPLVPPATGQVLVRTAYTLMSTGTENIVFNREFEPGTSFESWAGRGPFEPGYLAAGRIEELGAGVSAFAPGDPVFVRRPHASHHTVEVEACTRLPRSLDLRDAVWCGLAKIAFRAVHAAGFGPGQRVVIVGAGPIGQMLVRWARASGLETIAVVDPAPLRLELARRGGATAVIARPLAEAGEALRALFGGRRPALLVDTTGNAAVFADALRAVARFGKVVLLGDTGRPSEQRLTHDVIGKGLTVVGVHDLHDRDGWDERAIHRTWLALVGSGRFPLEGLITHEFAPHDCAAAYALANARRHETLGIAFNWQGFPKASESPRDSVS
jgi:2-desacetyl-2-hydroxyethyl bacteriochlorophyllide A dehydrogenase